MNTFMASHDLKGTPLANPPQRLTDPRFLAALGQEAGAQKGAEVSKWLDEKAPDLLAGRLHSSINSSGTAIGLHKEGRLRALAVMLKNRSPLLPDVPTIDEAGVPQVTVRHWAGVFGPAKLPGEIVARLNKEINTALGRGEFD